MLKIYYDDKTIFLSDKKRNYESENDILYKEVDNTPMVKEAFFSFINDAKKKQLVLFNENLHTLLGYFSENFTVIEAAGGLVRNEEKKFLFIFRLNKWDLPKGKIEKGEDVKEAAIREVEEECGVSHLEIIKELPSTYHIYELKGNTILKRTYWFEMHCGDTSELIPQTEEDITEAKWLGKDDFEKVLKNTYPSIKDVLGIVISE